MCVIGGGGHKGEVWLVSRERVTSEVSAAVSWFGLILEKVDLVLRLRCKLVERSDPIVNAQGITVYRTNVNQDRTNQNQTNRKLE